MKPVRQVYRPAPASSSLAVATAMIQNGAVANTFSSSMKTPNSRNSAAAAIWIRRSGRCLPATAAHHDRQPVGDHHAQRVDLIQTPSQSLSRGQCDGGQHGLVAEFGEEEG